MRVIVRAQSKIDVPHIARAGRFFRVDGETVLEVLPQQEDPPEIEVEVTNPTTGTKRKEKRPDPHRVGRDSYDRIKADPRFTVIEEGSTSAVLTEKAMGTAKAEIARLATDNADLKIALASADEALKVATARIAELEAAGAPPAADNTTPAEETDPGAPPAAKPSSRGGRR